MLNHQGQSLVLDFRTMKKSRIGVAAEDLEVLFEHSLNPFWMYHTKEGINVQLPFDAEIEFHKSHVLMFGNSAPCGEGIGVQLSFTYEQFNEYVKVYLQPQSEDDCQAIIPILQKYKINWKWE